MSDSEMREKIVDALGLETDPDGIPEQLLVYDGDDNIIEATDYREEVDALMSLFTEEMAHQTAIARTEGKIFEFKNIVKHSQVSDHVASLRILFLETELASLKEQTKGGVKTELPLKEIDREALCADCHHPYRQHSGLAGCYQCDNDDFCEHFASPKEPKEKK